MDNEKFKKWLDKALQILLVIVATCWTVIKWIFVFYAFILGTIFWLLDLWLGDGRDPVYPPWNKPHRNPKFNAEQFRQEIGNMKVEDVLKEFDKKIEQLDKKDQLDQEEKKVVKKLRGLDRSALRSQLRSSLTNQELEMFFILLLKILSGEIS